MKPFLLKARWFFLVCMGLFGSNASGQVITVGKDSTVVRPANAPIPTEEETKGLSGPGKAALLSAALPGLGQAYNKSYWKIPLIYAAGGVIGYVLYDNHHNYLGARSAINRRLAAGKDGKVEDEFTAQLAGRPLDEALNALRRRRDFHRRWRDYNIVYSILAYGLNITEAYVHAHLKGFDVGEDLALQVRPNLLPTSSAMHFTPGLTFSLNLKK